MLVLPALAVCKGMSVLQVPQVHRASKVFREMSGPQVRQEPQVSPDPLGHQARQARQALPARRWLIIRDRGIRRVRTTTEISSHSLMGRAILPIRPYPQIARLQVPTGICSRQKAQPGQRVQLAPQVSVRQAQRVLLAPQDRPAPFPDPQGLRGPQGLPGPQAQPGQPALLESGPQARLDRVA